MLFRDLMDVTHDTCDRIDRRELERLLPSTPGDVLEDLYSDHGRKVDSQRLYGALDINRMSWMRVSAVARSICDASMHPEFERWYRTVVNRCLENYSSSGWPCIDTRPDVVRHWSEHRTWRRAPVFFDESVIHRGRPLHLVEGHTRSATLTGLVSVGALREESEHSIWLGCCQ